MQRFTNGELEVMRILWNHGEMKPAEIQAEFSREIKNPALRSYLTILLRKRHVTRRKKGRAYYYKPRTSREWAFRSMYRNLAQAFCDGSTEALLYRLIKLENLSDEELLDLKRLADEEGRKNRSRG